MQAVLPYEIRPKGCVSEQFKMICESRAGLQYACGQTSSMYYNVADSVPCKTTSFPMLSLHNSAEQILPSLPVIHGNMAQDFQQIETMNRAAVLPQIEDPYNFLTQPASRGLSWCFGLQSDVAKEWSYLVNKSGTHAAGSKVAAETCVEGGIVVVRSLSCPWSSTNVQDTYRSADSDLILFHRILDDAFPSDCRQVGWCKYCATLEKELMSSLEVKVSKWADDNSLVGANFKQMDQYFEPRTTMPVVEHDSRKRKYEQNDWESDRAQVLLKLNELNTRTKKAEQRVLELEQLLRDPVVLGLDDTCDDSDIVTSASQHGYFHEPTVNGEMCHFETIHSGVLSYHRKHSLAHQRREDWHISCPFCQSKFARQHEMERHRRICKSRPQPSQASPNSNGSSVQSTVTGTLSEASLNHPTQLPDYMVPTRRNYDHQLFKMSGTKFNIESGITL
uniref:C2H2-type domain-containing protein n=1 Tax=Physcomitrium patens TaxID=3218 RepID=A0A7I4FGK0_PHYPA